MRVATTAAAALLGLRRCCCRLPPILAPCLIALSSSSYSSSAPTRTIISEAPSSTPDPGRRVPPMGLHGVGGVPDSGAAPVAVAAEGAPAAGEAGGSPRRRRRRPGARQDHHLPAALPLRARRPRRRRPHRVPPVHPLPLRRRRRCPPPPRRLPQPLPPHLRRGGHDAPLRRPLPVPGRRPRALGRLLVSRPTIIPRSALDPEKLDLLRRTRLAPAHPMYKYALSVLAISRLDTLRAKLANLEKFGFSCDDVMGLFARTPNVLTLSVDKVQRNMTYIVGTVKLPPRSVLDEPALLYCNLEKVLRPRHLLVVKLRQMGLRPTPQVKEPYVVKAVRMPERRFLRSFVTCHEDAVARELMEYYENVKGLRRLAESSRSTRRLGFPF
uniref:Uncharacterized protein n=1 Tax=Ananas comosus var. bracteatus TaxID=296719 RepID=A0A6V7NEK4_ANACO|nr:unnamed protein product [Ananas comosus var. bracteatus]